MALLVTNYSVGIYGIQDIRLSDFPEFVHDHSIAIFKNGECLDYLHLERFSRRKYDNRLQDYLYDVLKIAGLAGKSNVDVIFSDNVIGRSFVASEGDIRFEAPIAKTLAPGYEKGILRWYGKEKPGYLLNHELAHIYSMVPFFGKFKENSLLIHFDGGASKSNFSAWLWRNNKMELVEYGWDLEYLSSFYNSNALLFSVVGAGRKEQNAVPGKLMGLAGFGRYDEKVEKWLRQNSFFKDIWGGKKSFFSTLEKDWGIKLNQFDTRNEFIQTIAATIQAIFERDFLKKLSRIQSTVKADYLYYSGGAALNIVLNSKLLKDALFDDVFIPPCPGDSGLSLGAAAFLELRKGHTIHSHSPFLNSFCLKDYNQFQYSKEDIKNTATLLVDKKVVGVCNGEGEIGPRALGNRSIIALANSKKLAEKVSTHHKKREWYRPVAPVMLERNTKYFTGLSNVHHLSKFMLLEFDIQKEKQKELEGTVHIDGTSRIQTIFKREENPFLYDLLDYLDLKYNVKALINTSFNKKGEPIVHTHEDALESAKNMGLDAVILNGKLKVLSTA